VVCRLAVEESLSWMAWVTIGAAVALFTVARWPYGAVIVLIACSVTPRFFIEVFGWKARPEHFAVALISVIVGVWFLRHRGEVRLEKLDYWVLAYVAINYFSSAFRSSEPSATLRWAVQNNLAVLAYFLIRFLVQDLGTLRKAFRILLAVGLVESAYGIFCFASYHAFGTMFGMDLQYFGEVAAPYGTLYEPNLFGAYTACLAVLFLSLYLGTGRYRFACMIGFIVASLATVLSLSRAVLIAFVFALLWMVRKTRQANTRRNWRVITLVPAVALVLLLIATPIRAVLQERFANLISQGLTEETTITRYVALAAALQDLPAHPLLGSGTASFQLSFDWAKYVPEWTNAPNWIGNVVVRIVHDTGLVGLVLVLGFLVSIWRQVRQNLRQRTHETPILLGLWAGTLLYCITFEATDGSMLAFTWVHLGFLASTAILIKAQMQNVRGEPVLPSATTTQGQR
jgi:oligosaccharide repeat unit polymerase